MQSVIAMSEAVLTALIAAGGTIAAAVLGVFLTQMLKNRAERHPKRNALDAVLAPVEEAAIAVTPPAVQVIVVVYGMARNPFAAKKLVDGVVHAQALSSAASSATATRHAVSVESLR